MEMDRSPGESPDGIGSVKAAIVLYGQGINGRNKKDLYSETGERLQKAKMDVGRFKETKKSAEKKKTRAEVELFKAKIAARELAEEVEKSNTRARAMARKLESSSTRKVGVHDQKYSELMQELSNMKQELRKLKLDVAAALESKAKAEKMIEASNQRAKSYIYSAEEMGKEIDELNEEHVLVELARIEAEREYREIEAQRRDEAARFSKEIEETKKKILVLQKEAEEAKDLEKKLAVTNSDLNVLQGEMDLVRAMERNSQKNKVEESSELLKAAQAELQAAKKELVNIKEEGFQFMSSMDVIRNELVAISKETKQLRKQEMKADASIQQLNSKLLRANARLEAAKTEEERSTAILSNLSSALEKLRADMEAAKKEKEKIAEETERARKKTELVEEKISATEEQLQTAMEELEASKASEAVALSQLREIVERTMKNRVSASAQLSTITISKTEYEYLMNNAETAKLVADKKVAAAQAWVKALQAEEKEIMMRIKQIEQEAKEVKAAEGDERFKTEKVLVDLKNKGLENGLGDAEEAEFTELQQVLATPRKSMRESRMSMQSARKAKVRRSSVSSSTRYYPQSPSFAIKRRTAIPNLVKFLRRGSTKKEE